jgi:signal transduction histidine kinase
VLVRDLALAEEKLLQELCDAVLNDDHEEAKRIARELRTCAA